MVGGKLLHWPGIAGTKAEQMFRLKSNHAIDHMLRGNNSVAQPKRLQTPYSQYRASSSSAVSDSLPFPEDPPTSPTRPFPEDPFGASKRVGGRMPKVSQTFL